jgi:hypothetical protein
MADRSSTQLVRGGAVELAKPVIELRELVETFRSHDVVVEGWQDIVRRAIATMTAFDRGCPGQFPALVRIVTGLDVLLEVGWSADARLLETLSAEIVDLLPAVVPTGIPRPDDPRSWAFPSG